MDLTVPSRPTLAPPLRQPPPAPPAPAPAGPGVPPPASPMGPPPAVHDALVCVALPSFALSAPHGQLTGHGIEGVYTAGRRVLGRCRLRVAGREPVTLQGRLVSAGRAQFTAVVPVAAGPGPDPDIGIERTRDADGTERITFRSSAGRPVRVPVEIALGTDLADLGTIASGRPRTDLRPTVHEAGLRWTAGDGGRTTVTADPPPDTTLASAGLLRWDLEVRPGTPRTLTLAVRSVSPHRPRPVGATPGHGLTDAHAEGDDPRVDRLLRASLADLRALLVRDPAHPSDLHLAAGVPWRCGPAPAEALWAARMALPLGTRLAVGTLRTLARTQLGGPGPGAGFLPGPLRDAGPHLPPGCTGTEATLGFPAVLAEARRWGLPEQDLAELLPAAERCLHWLRTTAGEDGLLADPGDRGPSGLQRAETQAHAHRAALLGAELLEACGRPGADHWRDWARALRLRFREAFWLDDPAGGRPAAARTLAGRPVPHLGGTAAHLLDTGLLGGGRYAEGLLDKAQTEQLARLLGSPAMDSGWGLRGLGAREPGHNPFGHRSGAVRVHETAVAVAGLAAAGHEREAGSLLRGLLDAAEAFAYRLPEMYAGDQRTTGSVPVPHPAACRPAAIAAAAGVHLLAAVAGIRPDAPARTVALHPLRGAPLGAVRLSGLCVAGEPFAVRVSRLGLGMVEEAAPGLQLGV
ncbi:glycogen debranching N-terminal domain-containing protein [Streptomyces sp. NPDC015131]|uniref:glycogen debranching N-terminal domain-containing protein n=1 Tax=Streptomyces sp. NPDC015131 TaxID=3364941 RepID=UPI0036FDB728